MTRTAPWVAFAAVILLALPAMMLVNLRQDVPAVNQDVAINLVTGRAIAAGRALYADWIDNNPPSIYFVSAAIALVSGGDARVELAIFVLAIMAVAVFGSRLIWLTAGSLTHRSAFLACYLFIVTGSSLPPFEFGQREQVFLLFFVPWVVMRQAGAPITAARMAWAVSLAYFAAMKPPFVLLLAWFELWAGKQERRAWIALATGLMAPFVVLRMVSVASFVAFFTTIVPYELGGGPAAYREPFRMFFTGGGWSPHALTVAALAALGWAWRTGLVHRRSVVMWAGLVVLANLAVLQQQRFYSYHFILIAGLAALALSAIVAAWLEQLPPLRLGAESFAVSCIAVAVIGANTLGLAREWLAGVPPEEAKAAALLDGHERALFVGTSIEHVYAHFYAGVEPAGHWTFDYTLPGIIANADEGERRARLAAYGEQLNAAIDKEQPTAIVFTAANQAMRPFYRYSFPADYSSLAPYLRTRAFDASIRNVHGYWLVFERRRGTAP